jgi:hypothetical protein
MLKNIQNKYSIRIQFEYFINRDNLNFNVGYLANFRYFDLQLFNLDSLDSKYIYNSNHSDNQSYDN